MLCKLDVEKAYDHVSWDFLMYKVLQMGKVLHVNCKVLHVNCKVFYPDQW